MQKYQNSYEVVIMEEKYQKGIGERIRELRLKKNMTQQELANIPTLRVQRNLVNYWENDERDIKSWQIIALADFFNVTCDYILRGIEAENVDIHKKTGLSETAINILSFYKDYKIENFIKTINFLIEQEELNPLRFFDTILKRYGDDELEAARQFEKSIKTVNDDFAKWKDKNYLQIINLINRFFNIRIDEKKFYKITGTEILLINNDLNIDTNPEETIQIIMGDDLINGVLLSDIFNLMKKAKEKYIEWSDKNAT